MPVLSGQAYTCRMTTVLIAPTESPLTNGTTTAGEEFIRKIMRGDSNGAAALLAPDVHLRGVTPRRLIELNDRDAAMAMFDLWFGQGWRDGLDGFSDTEVLGRRAMTYRVRWSNAYGQRFAFEQHVYYETTDNGITWIELVCSGHRPLD